MERQMIEPVAITSEEPAIAMVPKERRRTLRHPCGRVAAIMFGQGKEHPCLVKDYSDGGVRL
jgi:hypothetical protein